MSLNSGEHLKAIIVILFYVCLCFCIVEHVVCCGLTAVQRALYERLVQCQGAECLQLEQAAKPSLAFITTLKKLCNRTPHSMPNDAVTKFCLNVPTYPNRHCKNIDNVFVCLIYRDPFIKNTTHFCLNLGICMVTDWEAFRITFVKPTIVT